MIRRVSATAGAAVERKTHSVIMNMRPSRRALGREVLAKDFAGVKFISLNNLADRSKGHIHYRDTPNNQETPAVLPRFCDCWKLGGFSESLEG